MSFLEVATTQDEWRELLKDKRFTFSGYGLAGESRVIGIRDLSEWKESRAKIEVLTEELIHQLSTARSFCQLLEKRKTRNTKHSSYGLKHAAERYSRRLDPDRNYYVSSGVFCCAAVLEGFKLYGYGNPELNVSTKSLKFAEHASV